MRWQMARMYAHKRRSIIAVDICQSSEAYNSLTSHCPNKLLIDVPAASWDGTRIINTGIAGHPRARLARAIKFTFDAFGPPKR